MSDFNNLLSYPGSIEFLREQGHGRPTPVQAQALPVLKAGDSASILAQTGSGKTLAYILPLAERLKALEAKVGPSDAPGRPRAVVLAPTRELAQQIMQVFKGLGHHLKLRVRLLDAGDKGRTRLAGAPFDVLVAVPGKLRTALKGAQLSLAELGMLVLDEADQLMDASFKKELESIWQSCPRSPEGRPLAQVVLVSATMPVGFIEFRDKLFRGVSFRDVHLIGAHEVPHFVETFNIYLSAKEKLPMTREFLAREAQGNGIIFINKKEDVGAVCSELKALLPGRKFTALHGGMAPKERRRALEEYKKDGEILVSSDIVARGMDMHSITWVLNYDLPFEAVYYIHRAGRAGRGQRSGGKVYNLVTSKDTPLIARINEAIQGQSALKLGTIQDRFEEARRANAKQAAKKLAQKALDGPKKSKQSRPGKKKAAKKTVKARPSRNLKRTPGNLRRKR